jgi:hypothetical protein
LWCGDDCKRDGQEARQHFTWHEVTLHVANKCRRGIMAPTADVCGTVGHSMKQISLFRYDCFEDSLSAMFCQIRPCLLFQRGDQLQFSDFFCCCPDGIFISRSQHLTFAVIGWEQQESTVCSQPRGILGIWKQNSGAFSLYREAKLYEDTQLHNHVNHSCHIQVLDLYSHLGANDM